MTKHLFILVIDTKYGTDATAHATEESAREELYEYVADNWGAFQIEDHGELATLDRDAAIDAYFREHFCQDWYHITPATLKADSSP